jgi:uncharacterized protein YcfL
MKKKVISLLLVSTLLFGCGSTKSTTNTEIQTEVVSGEHDPLMKLLLSGLIIFSLNLLLTK